MLVGLILEHPWCPCCLGSQAEIKKSNKKKSFNQMERNGQCTLIKPAVSQVINGFWQSHETCKTWNVLGDLRHPLTIQGLRHVEMNNIEAGKGS